ncbi:hypothetical protein K450DRAFT_221944 [Umbelopsis ramanniana AG]|uniref:UBX domain-containing protein n=1 Tax=Umbelopsis ramanniana AG TaxID=1314678 RepID=A0AAD5EGU8_UMBRA|nr:uncharacterized protein K450DRAFT_221944 [Umbelopsis ramanniana AG]KAI8583603.1 hypothetical protein K450DRAFT_221944 [Umbelopsis ramanniana AG]
MSVTDEKLVQLLQLGFDLETSKSALMSTSTVEEAVERILSGSQTQSSAIHAESVQSNRTAESMEVTMNSEDFTSSSISSRYSTAGKDQEYRQTALRLASEMKRKKVLEQEAHRRALQQIHEDRETIKERNIRNPGKSQKRQVENSDSNATSLGTLEQVSAIQDKMKLEKQSEKEARRRVLQSIEEDKQTRKRSNAHKITNPAESSSANLEKPKVVQMGDHALIQFRMPDGHVERKQFTAEDTIKTILEYALQILSSNDFRQGLDSLQMSTTFPRRTYTIADGSSTAKQTGLAPSCTLNVSIIASEAPPQDNTFVGSEGTSTNIDMVIDSTESSFLTNDDINELNGIDVHTLGMPPQMARRGPSARGRRARGQRGSQRFNARTWGGVGRSLADNDDHSTGTTGEGNGIPVSINPPIEDRDAIRQIRSRLHGNKPNAAMTETSKVVKKSQRKISSLRDICTSAVAVFLTSPTKQTSAYLKPLDKVSPEIAAVLLNHLIYMRKLDRTVLKRLISHCYLQECVFDAYSYATDSLLDELCQSASSCSIRKLSLSGCDIITSAGIQHIYTLRYLEHLDLSNCKATDKCLDALISLPNLNHLYLSKTKVTSKGLEYFTQNALSRDSLQTLVLNGCQGVDGANTFSLISNFPNLLFLNLASLNLPSPCDIPTSSSFKALEALDVSNTGVCDVDVRRIFSCMKNLREFKLAGCRSISVFALSFLGRELGNLEDIRFPNQNQDLNDCLIHYSKLNMTHLDLGNFKETNDVGMQHIANMHQLRFLSLEGTQITDDGLLLLKEMEHLEQLFLDRTTVSDRGIESIRNFPSIVALSLSHTFITDKTLHLIGDPITTRFTRVIRSLSVAGCQVTNKGIKSLKSMINLHSLNLDRTNANVRCKVYLQGLEYLRPFRVAEPVNEDETSDSSDPDATANGMILF